MSLGCNVSECLINLLGIILSTARVLKHKIHTGLFSSPITFTVKPRARYTSSYFLFALLSAFASFVSDATHVSRQISLHFNDHPNLWLQQMRILLSQLRWISLFHCESDSDALFDLTGRSRFSCTCYYCRKGNLYQLGGRWLIEISSYYS